MKTKINLLLIAVILLALNSCTVQKRLYNKGYHVEWRYSINQNKKSVSPSISKLEVQNDEKEEIKSDLDSLLTNLSITIIKSEVDQIISEDKEEKQVSTKKVYHTKNQHNKFKVKNRLKNDLTSLENKSTDEEPKYKKVKAKDWTILAWINFIAAVLTAIFLVPLFINFVFPLCIFLLLAFVSNHNSKKVWKYNDVKAQNPKNRSVLIIFTVFGFLLIGALYITLMSPFMQIVMITILSATFLISMIINEKKYADPMYKDQKEQAEVKNELKPKQEKPKKEPKEINQNSREKRTIIQNKAMFWFYMVMIALLIAVGITQYA